MEYFEARDSWNTFTGTKMYTVYLFILLNYLLLGPLFWLLAYKVLVNEGSIFDCFVFVKHLNPQLPNH